MCGAGVGLSASNFAHAFDLAGLLLGNEAAATIVGVGIGIGVGVGLDGASGLCSEMAGAEAEVLSEAPVLLSQYVRMTVVTAGATSPDAVGECCAEVDVEAEVEVASGSPLSRGCCELRALLRSAAHSRSHSCSCAVQAECAGAGRSTLIKCVSESLDRKSHADADAGAADGDEDCSGQGTPAAAADPLLAGADAEAEAVAASKTMLADLLSAVS